MPLVTLMLLQKLAQCPVFGIFAHPGRLVMILFSCEIGQPARGQSHLGGKLPEVTGGGKPQLALRIQPTRIRESIPDAEDRDMQPIVGALEDPAVLRWLVLPHATRLATVAQHINE